MGDYFLEALRESLPEQVPQEGLAPSLGRRMMSLYLLDLTERAMTGEELLPEEWALLQPLPSIPD